MTIYLSVHFSKQSKGGRDENVELGKRELGQDGLKVQPLTNLIAERGNPGIIVSRNGSNSGQYLT